MANINLAGVLRDPLGEYSYLNKIRFTHTTTTGQTLAGFRSVHKVAEDGSYNIDLEYGNVFIETNDRLNTRWIDHGTITINSDTPATDLPSLLGITTPVTDPDLLVIQALVEDANQYAQASEAGAVRAEDAAAEAELVAGSAKMVARALNITNSEVTEVEAGALLDGVAAVYDPTQELSYYLDGKVGTSETITSLTDNVLVTSGGTYYLRVVPDAGTTLPVPVVTALNSNELETRVDGGITFTRATTRHNINKSGVLEELAIDEVGVTKDGFSFYGNVTNLLTYSEDFTQSAWVKRAGSAVEITSEVIDPKGGGAATKHYNTNTTTSGTYIRQVDAFTTDDTVYTAYMIVKKGSQDTCGLTMYSRLEAVSNCRIELNYDTRELTINESGSVSGTEAGYVEMNNGWFLVWGSANMLTGTNNTGVEFTPSVWATPTAVGVEYGYIFCGQVTESSVMEPYVKTEASQFAATADFCQFPVMNNLPVSGSAWSVSISAALPEVSVESSFAWQISSKEAGTVILLRRYDTGAIEFYYDKSDATDRAILVYGVDTEVHLITCVYEPGQGMRVYIDGALVGENATDPYDVCSFNVQSNFTLGSQSNGTNHLNSNTENLRVYHCALTDKQASKEFVK